MNSEFVFTCVTEPTKKFLDQSARLLLSLRWFGGRVADSRFVLGTTGPIPDDALAFFRKYRAEILLVDRYDSSHGPSNKLALMASPELAGHGVVVLMDCDTVILQDPSGGFEVAGIAAKPADLATVKNDQLAEIFRFCGKPFPEARFQHELSGTPCIAYCNSGVIVVKEQYRARLATAWDKWNRLLLKAPDTLRFKRINTDQASLAVAIEDSGIPFQPLPTEFNFPTHFGPDAYPESWQERDPVIIHYHWLAYPHGTLKTCPLNQVNRRIESFNARLRAEFNLVSAGEKESSSSPPEARPKVVVGSGWWCDRTPSEWLIGTPKVKAVEFFDLWYKQVVSCLRPHRIVVTDSAAPLKPDFLSYELVNWIELDKNYGHPNDIRTGKINTKYSGFTRTVISGAMYALCCDADYYVYVEQDCLLHGENLLDRAVGDAGEDILLGPPTENGRGLSGGTAAPMLQQSLMIVRRSGLERFISGLLGAKWSDGEMSPEKIMRHCLVPYGYVQIPFGRSRPIDFDKEHFYAQHLDESEFEQMLKVLGLDFPASRFAFASLPE